MRIAHYLKIPLNTWRFYDLSRDDYTKCLQKEFPNNLYNVWLTALWFAIYMFVYMTINEVIMPITQDGFSRLLERGVTASRVGLITLMVAAFGIGLFSRHKYYQHRSGRPTSTVLIYALLLATFSAIIGMGIYAGVWSNPTSSATIFMILLIASMFLFTASPMFNISLVLIASAVFIIFTIHIKEPFVWSWDINNLLAAAPFAIVFNWFTNLLKFKSARGAIYLEDTVVSRTSQLRQRSKELFATKGAIIMGMSLLSESRDKVTGAHISRIKALTDILAKKIAEKHPDILYEDVLELITEYSPLHDIGKVSVSDAVLNKSGKLTSEEFEQMKAHTTDGGDLLRQVAKFLPSEQNYLNVAIDIAQSHHERFDGTGYPHGLVGEDIPISARIVSVADVYDALRSSRPYKRGFTHEESMDILLNGDGRTSPKHFDPIVLDVLKEVHEDICLAFDSNPDTDYKNDSKT